jgi:DNA-binding MarR family transcriptional regulator
MTDSEEPTARDSDQPAPGAFPAELAADLRVALLLTARRLRAEKADTDLTDSQYCVLAALDRNGTMTPGALAARERVQPPSMTRVLSCLAEQGLVSRDTHPQDRRQVLIRLTDAGRATVRETQRRRNAWLIRRLIDLDHAERQILSEAAGILRRIAES